MGREKHAEELLLIVKEIEERTRRGETPQDITQALGERIQIALVAMISELLAEMEAALVRLLTTPAPIKAELVSFFEAILVDSGTQKHRRWMLSMILSALEDESAVESAAAITKREKR